jgi:hypothetical protein
MLTGLDRSTWPDVASNEVAADEVLILADRAEDELPHASDTKDDAELCHLRSVPPPLQRAVHQALPYRKSQITWPGLTPRQRHFVKAKGVSAFRVGAVEGLLKWLGVRNAQRHYRRLSTCTVLGELL